MAKIIKMKDLIKESTWKTRKFGEPLPTMEDYKTAYNKKHNLTEAEPPPAGGEEEPPKPQKLKINIPESPFEVDSEEIINSLKQILKEEFGDIVNEGPAYEWDKVYSNAEKAYMQFQKAIDELGRYTTKKTGEKTDQKIFEKQWKKQVVPFYKLMKSWIRGKL